MPTEYSIPRTQNPMYDEPANAGIEPAKMHVTTNYIPAPAAFGGIGIGGMLFIIFLVLKLAQVKPFKNWSYWRVTAPLWIPVAIGILVVLLASVFMNR